MVYPPVPSGSFSSVLSAEARKIGKERAVIVVGARLGDHVDGSAFRAAIFGGEALGADLEFLHGFERKLHDGTADGVVFIIDTIDGDVDVATTLSVDGKNRVTVFGGIVRIGSFNAGSEIGEVGDVATEKRKLFNFTGSDVLADAGLGQVDQMERLQ